MTCAVCGSGTSKVIAGFTVCDRHASDLLAWLRVRKGSPVSWWISQFGTPEPE